MRLKSANPGRRDCCLPQESEGTITSSASDIDLADIAKYGNIPHVTIWDAVAEHILGSKER